jgi:putative FmdB family regulatory protein
MPLYEYQCESCGHRFEQIQKFSDPPLTECPNCGGPLRKLLSSPAIQFKGSGWYITDYARDAKGPKDAKDSKDVKDTKDTKETKETKEKETKDAKTTSGDKAGGSPDTATKKPA